MTTASVSPSAVSAVHQSTNATSSSNQGLGVWDKLLSLKFGNTSKDSTFKFLTSPQRSKPASTVDADTFYMYACGSINMP